MIFVSWSLDAVPFWSSDGVSWKYASTWETKPSCSFPYHNSICRALLCAQYLHTKTLSMFVIKLYRLIIQLSFSNYNIHLWYTGFEYYLYYIVFRHISFFLALLPLQYICYYFNQTNPYLWTRALYIICYLQFICCSQDR